MLSSRAFIALTFATVLILIGVLPGFFAQEKKLNWYKGNTHTHTVNSDGDSTPDEVVRWYREHKYNFLVLSDHNFLTDVGGLNSVLGAKEKFLLIPGEEITDKFEKKDIHINGLNPRELVKPTGGNSVVETIQNNVNAIRQVEGVPHINHPNFNWSITADDLKRIKNLRLFEIYNGHPTVNNLGGGGLPSLEAMWDDILSGGPSGGPSGGMLIYGIAVDDAHVFKAPEDTTKARPGFGWVMVRAERLGATEILQAMERGDFYASTGVTLRDYQADKKQIVVTIAEQPATSKYVVQFIGQWGKVLKDVTTNPATYTFKGDELYVRAKVIESNGKFAWTQPVFLKQ